MPDNESKRPATVGGYGALVKELLAEAVKPRGLRTPKERFLEQIDPTAREAFEYLCREGGIIGESLAGALLDISYMKGLRLNPRTGRNTRRKMDRALRCVLKAEREVKDILSTPGHPPWLNTVRELQAFSDWLSRIRHGWVSATKRSRRGFSPETPFIIALTLGVEKDMEYPCRPELCKLISAAFRLAGSKEICTEKALNTLVSRNVKLHKGWKERLCGPMRYSPKKGRKMHAPRLRRSLLGTPSKAFTPPV